MKIASVEWRGTQLLAVERQGRWLNLSHLLQGYVAYQEDRASAPVTNLLPFLVSGSCTQAYLEQVLAFTESHRLLAGAELDGELRFRMPFRPGKVIAIGRNYKAHVAEFDNKMPKEPIYFSKATTACIGPEEPILVRESYGRVDHEAELGVVIGKRAKDVPAAQAQAYVAGYTLVNDVTARDLQKHDIADSQPWFRSKSIDTFCPLGPAIVLREALAWPPVVTVEARVNGEVRQHSDTGKFIFGIPELLEAITRYVTLEPGDIIATGTPEGVSPIRPGDVVEIEIPEIGILRNPVHAE